MSEPLRAENEPGRLTIILEAEHLRAEVLANTITHTLGCLRSIERSVTGQKRARLKWKVTELSWDGRKARISIEEMRE